jgi:CBS domain-containing protein
MDSVRRWMSSPAIVAPETMVLPEARQLMQKRHIRRLPVVDADERLVGIVSQGDIDRISDSHATDVREYNQRYQVSDLPISAIMTRDPVTVTPDTQIMEVAQLLLQHKIGGVPVVTSGRVVGVITESDLFRMIITIEEAVQPVVGVARPIELERLPRGLRQRMRL